MFISTLHSWLKEIYERRWPVEQAPSHQAITRSTARLIAQLNKLKKQRNDQEPKKSENITNFLQLDFVLPTMGYHKGRVVRLVLVQ